MRDRGGKKSYAWDVFRNFSNSHKFFEINESKFHKSNLPLKCNMDTNNGGLENVSPVSNMASFGVSIVNLKGVPRIYSHQPSTIAISQQ